MQTLSLQQKAKWTALGLAALGATLFSAKAVLIKLAYQYEVSTIDLMSLRMLFALPFYLFVLWFSQRNKKVAPLGRQLLARIALFGFLGYYMASYFDFWGLQYVSASMERLILFVYPTIVVLLSALFLRKKIRRTEAVAILLTYSGMFLAFAERVRIGDAAETLFGGSLIFVSAITYAIYLIGSGKLIPKIGTVRFTSLSMIVACICVVFHNLLINGALGIFDFPWQVYLLAFLIATISTVIPSYLISESIKRIGPSEVAITGNIGPIATIILSMLFLGETIGFWQWAGTAIVLAGVSFLSANKK